MSDDATLAPARANAASRPRKGAKAVVKIKAVATPVSVMGQIREHMQQVDALVNDARCVGGSGDPGERILYFAKTDLITLFYDTLQPEAFSRNSVYNALNVLYDVQSLLDGALALHPSDGRGVIIKQALMHIDAASELMDQPRFWPEEQQVSQGHIDEQREAFARGRDLVVAMFNEGYDLDGTDQAEALRWYRGGKAQTRFPRTHLAALIDDPDVLEGFSAAMAACIARVIGGGSGLGFISDLPLAEFEAGEIGADGTQVDEPVQPAAPGTPDAPSRAPQDFDRAFRCEDLVNRILSSSRLVDWIVSANGTLDAIEGAAEISPEMKRQLRLYDIRFPDWVASEMNDGISYILAHQRDMIEELRRGAA